MAGHLIRHTASVFVTYIFTNDSMRGFSVGVGGTEYGKQYGNAGDVVNGERIQSPAYHMFNLMVAYETEVPIFGRRVKSKLQLNIDNALDNDKLIYRSYQAYGNGQVQPMDYDFIEPRRYAVTATFMF